MADKPIIFSPSMVRALLDGRKTQTRRLLKPQPVWKNGFIKHPDWSGSGYETEAFFAKKIVNGSFPEFIKIRVGDRLWVRENWKVGAWHYGNSTIAVDYCDGPVKEWLHVDDPDLLVRLIEQSRADARLKNVPLHDGYWEHSWSPGDSPCRLRPSIHMPRWASRLTLTVSDVRVERLSDISRDDAISEGIHQSPTAPQYAKERGCDWTHGTETRVGSPVSAFADLWRSINGEDSWSENPWVAAYSFTVENRNIDK